MSCKNILWLIEVLSAAETQELAFATCPTDNIKTCILRFRKRMDVVHDIVDINICSTNRCKLSDKAEGGINGVFHLSNCIVHGGKSHGNL